MPINPDKIQEMESPFYAPQKDVYDGDSFGPVIQLGVTLNKFTGDLYMKSEHLSYIASSVLDMYSKEEYLAIVKEKLDVIEELSALKRENEELKSREQSDFNSRLDELFANYSDTSGRNDSASSVANVGNGSDTGETKHAKAARKSPAKVNLNIE